MFLFDKLDVTADLVQPWVAKCYVFEKNVMLQRDDVQCDDVQIL